MRLHTQIVGSGPDIVMLHGWGLNSQIWGDSVRELSQHARLTLIDLPGHGHSPTVEPYELQTVVHAIAAVAPPTAIWLGWSLGGLLSLAIAEAFPTRVLKLILVASNPSIAARADWPYGMQPAVLDQFAQNLEVDYAQTLQRFLMLQCKGSEHARETARTLRERLDTGGRPHIDALRGGLKILQTTDLRAHLPDVVCDCLLIYGQHDALVPVGGAPQVAAMLPRARAEIIAGAAHAPFVSHLSRFLELTLPFVHAA